MGIMGTIYSLLWVMQDLYDPRPSYPNERAMDLLVAELPSLETAQPISA